MEDKTGQLLRDWRHAQRAGAERIAGFLGITPAHLARLESGIEAPPGGLRARIRDMVAPNGPTAFVRRERLLRRSQDISVLVDLDGVRLLAVSDGLAQVWPEFATNIGCYMADHLVSTSRALLNDGEFVRGVRCGEIASVTGVSLKHVEIGNDPCMLHRWTAVSRPHGSRMILQVDFVSCPSDAALGVEQVLSAYEI